MSIFDLVQRSILVAILGGFTIVAAFFCIQEARFQFSVFVSDTEFDVAPLTNNNRTLSLSADEAKLLICEENFQATASGFLPVNTKAKFVAPCQFQAAQILKRAPVYSLAHMVLANVMLLSAHQLSFDRHLQLSQQFAPNEGWLSQRRFRYLSRYPSGANRTLLARETSAMLMSQQGAETLALELQNSPSLRPIILASVRRALPVYQQRFVNLVQSQTRQNE